MPAVSIVAAYRDRWGVNSDDLPLGPKGIATTVEHLGHRKRAQAALLRALEITQETRQLAPNQSPIMSSPIQEHERGFEP